ncbi:MAG: hypothetical protein AB1324_04580 [Candidatus Micrarchaeota archaeon]
MELRVTLNFGRHHSRADIPDLRKRLSGHCVFVDDSCLPDSERVERVKSINEGMKRVRRMMGRGFVMPAFGDAYNDILIEAMLPIRGMRYYLVEGYGPGRLMEIEGLREARDAHIDDIFRFAISCYRIQDAIAKTQDYIAATEKYIRARNAGIAEGFGRLPIELPSFFPELADGARVFGRFGSTHGALSGILASSGFAVESSEEPQPGFTARIVKKMTSGTGASLSETDVIKAMYSLLYSGFSHENRKEELVFEEMGFERGFLALLEDVAGTRGASEKFASALNACASRIEL